MKRFLLLDGQVRQWKCIDNDEEQDEQQKETLLKNSFTQEQQHWLSSAFNLNL